MTIQAEKYIGADGLQYSVRRTNVGDVSPIYPHWVPGKYNPKCPCCWAGTSHSQAVHDTYTRG